MKLSERIKPISYFKAHAAEIVRQINEVREPYIITQNGEAKAVVMDIDAYEETQETLALLKLLAMGEKEVEEGKVYPLDEAVKSVRRRLKKDAGL